MLLLRPAWAPWGGRSCSAQCLQLPRVCSCSRHFDSQWRGGEFDTIIFTLSKMIFSTELLYRRALLLDLLLLCCRSPCSDTAHLPPLLWCHRAVPGRRRELWRFSKTARSGSEGITTQHIHLDLRHVDSVGATGDPPESISMKNHDKNLPRPSSSSSSSNRRTISSEHFVEQFPRDTSSNNFFGTLVQLHLITTTIAPRPY